MSDRGAPDVVALGGGRFLVRQDGSQRAAYAVADGVRRWVFLDGIAYEIDTTPRGSARRTAHHDETALMAPMPATVVAIEAPPGAAVQPGDVLIRLEAMKMELPIRAPRAGTVTRVACQPGELVQPGVPLVELDGSE